MASRAVWTLSDYSGEKSGLSLNGPTLSSANYDAQIAEVSGIRSALDDITLGVIQQEQVISAVNVLSGSLPTSPYAQREVKLLFTYVDNTTGARHTFTVPMPDLAALTTSTGSDAILLEDAGVMAAFVSAVEGFAVAPVTGNAITIITCRVVGRNI